jgi:repressor LexA
MPEALTELERQVLDYLVQYLRVHTYQPSIRDIGREFSIKSTKTVSELLQSLAEKGWIERDPSRSRGVHLLGVELQPDTVSVPVYIEPDGAPQRSVVLDRQIASAAGSYIVGMPDGSLRSLGVEQGDLLLVEPVEASQLAAGDLVFAVQGGTPLVRPLATGGQGRQLETPGGGVGIPLAGVQVRGRVHALIRRLRVTEAAAPAAVARLVAT